MEQPSPLKPHTLSPEAWSELDTLCLQLEHHFNAPNSIEPALLEWQRAGELPAGETLLDHERNLRSFLSKTGIAQKTPELYLQRTRLRVTACLNAIEEISTELGSDASRAIYPESREKLEQGLTSLTASLTALDEWIGKHLPEPILGTNWGDRVQQSAPATRSFP